MKRTELLEYFKTERAKFEKIREIQWKFNIALWGLLSLGIKFLDKDIVGKNKWMITISIFLFLCSQIMFAILTEIGLARSIKLSNKILDALDSSNEEFIPFSTRRIQIKGLKRNGVLWVIFQLLATTVLILILIMKLNS